MKFPDDIQSIIDAINHSSTLGSPYKRRLMNVINEYDTKFGYTSEGKFNFAVFGAKGYDLQALQHNCPPHIHLIPISSALNKHTAILAKGCKAICIFVNDQCDRDAIHALSSYGVQLIALRCAGFNNVDLSACKEFGIAVVRVPAYSPYAVAEHTIALMLMLNRNLHKAYLRNRSGQFLLDGLVGFDMYGKTVGVIGTGKIGQCVISILRGFGCQVLAYDPFPNEQLMATDGVTYTTKHELFKQSHIVTLHSPLNDDTFHMIDNNSIAMMRDGVMLINTSRGALVDTKALIEGLKSGKIAKAGLDVYEEESDIFFEDKSETIIDDDTFARLMTFNNVVITSHQAFLTDEALNNIAQTTFANLQEFIEGKPLSHAVHA